MIARFDGGSCGRVGRVWLPPVDVVVGLDSPLRGAFENGWSRSKEQKKRKEKRGKQKGRANSRTTRLVEAESRTPSSGRGCVTNVTMTDVLSMFATAAVVGIRTAVVSRVANRFPWPL